MNEEVVKQQKQTTTTDATVFAERAKIVDLLSRYFSAIDGKRLDRDSGRNVHDQWPPSSSQWCGARRPRGHSQWSEQKFRPLSRDPPHHHRPRHRFRRRRCAAAGKPDGNAFMVQRGERPQFTSNSLRRRRGIPCAGSGAPTTGGASANCHCAIHGARVRVCPQWLNRMHKTARI